MKRTLFFLLACCMATQIYAQKTPVTGKVLDETGQPVSGAVIKINGTSDGAATDIDGNFKLSVGVGAHLTVTYMGYNAKDVIVTAAKNLTITLDVKTNSDLNEVVVVGYGTAKKVTLTGAVSSITGKEVSTTHNENILNSMAGKLVGVRILQTSSLPGGYNTSFDIRGYGGTPLIIIDGVASDVPTLERIDSQDIDQISVLKDGAAAVYGVKAANGVVLVTTRRGKAGTSVINYNFTGGAQFMNSMPKESNPVEWMTLMNEQSMHNISNPTTTFPAASFTPYLNGTLQGTDWRAATLRDRAPEFNHNLSASGGTDKATYFASIGYNDQEGFYKSGDLSDSKYNFRANMTAKISKSLSFDMQLSGTFDTQHSPYASTSTIFGDMNRNPPTVPVYINNSLGYLYNTLSFYGGNLVGESTSDVSGYRLNSSNAFYGGLGLTYEVPYVKGLKARVFYNYDYATSDNKAYMKSYNLYNAVTPATNPPTYSPVPQNTPSTVAQAYAGGSTGFLQFQLNYDHTFNSVHNITALALYEQYTSKSDGFSAQRNESLNTDQLSAGSATGQIGTGNTAGYSTLKSWVGKLHYDYKSKYLIDFTGRVDGSSTFPASKQYGFFPSVSAAYRISEEPFFKNIPGLSFITSFKLRGSYGVLGDASVTSQYQFISGYDFPASGSVVGVPAGSVFDGAFVNGVGFRALANPDITWTTSKTTDVGVDAEFWHGLFGFTADYFNRLRTGLIGTLLQSIPGDVGSQLPQANLNSDETRGVELTLTSSSRIGQVGLNLSANAGFTRTKNVLYTQLHAGSDNADWINNGYKSGRWNDVLFGYNYVGQFQSFNQIRSYPVNTGGGNKGSLPGDYIYQDWNNDGVVDGQDYHQIGVNPSRALLNFGFSIGANYKAFDFNAVFQGAAGDYVVLPIWYSYPLDHQGNAFEYFFDRWHPVDPTANPYNPNTVYTPGYFAYTGSNINQSSNGPNGLQSTTYLRLKTIELGYTMPQSILRKVGITKMRFFVSAYDLLTITGLKFNDPEHPSENNGTDYPLNHTILAGVNATF